MESWDTPKDGGAPAGCAGELSWFGRSFYETTFRLAFYRQALTKGTVRAAVFFLLFAIVLTLFNTFVVLWGMRGVSGEIREAFESGEFPAIVIEDGIASVDGPQPFVLSEDDGFFVLDTTGQTEEIDRSRYSQGFLLTRDELHMLNDGEYQTLDLSDLHTFFGVDQIVIDQNSAVRLWRGFSWIIGGSMFVVTGLWNSVVSLMFISFLSLLVWGAIALLRRPADYGKTLTLALYAFAPATYVQLLMRFLDVQFLGLKTLLLLAIWGYLAFQLFDPAGQAAIDAGKGEFTA